MYKSLTFNLGREALRYIIETYAIKEMYIPYYLCDVVRHTLVEEGCKPVFYHIDDNFFPSEDFPKEDFILYPNYWGVCKKNVKKLVSIYPKLIVDNAHAYYDTPSGFACFNAGHKFGYEKSVLWLTDNNFNADTDIIIDKNAKQRQKIFFELHRKYSNINLLKVEKFFGTDTSPYPFVYPCLTDTAEAADNLVKQLKEDGKTVFRYWNPLPKSFLEYIFYSRLVPIPVLPLS